MNVEEYSLIGSLTDCLEWCYEQLEEISPQDDKVIREVLSQANKQIEQGYLD